MAVSFSYSFIKLVGQICNTLYHTVSNVKNLEEQDVLMKHIRITSVNSTNQASDVCRRTTSGSDNNNPHSNVNNNMTTSNNLLHVFDFKQYEVDKKYSPQCKRENPVLL